MTAVVRGAESPTPGTRKPAAAWGAKQAGAPPLPADLNALMIDLQAFVNDYGKQLDAQIAGDDASVAVYQANVQADLAKFATYDIDAIGKEIDAYYKPLIERFNSEIAAATA